MKICCKCKHEKELKEFYIRKDSPDGYRNDCIECRRILDKRYNDKPETKQKKLISNRNWRKQNPEKVLAQKIRSRPKQAVHKRQKRMENPEHFKAINKKYYQKHKERILKETKDTRLTYYYKNKKKVIAKQQIYVREREKVDLNYKLTRRLRIGMRTRLKQALAKKSGHTMDLVGCTIEYLIKHLESKFQDGMNWENYGKWHIDHIKPCCSFDLTKEKDQKECFHYTNLQPLWAKDNLTKLSQDLKFSKRHSLNQIE